MSTEPSMYTPVVPAAMATYLFEIISKLAADIRDEAARNQQRGIK